MMSNFHSSSDNKAGLVIGGITILFIGAIFVSLVGEGISDCSGHTHNTAQQEAEKWLRDMGIKAKVQCADVDTDNDGYVSCPYVPEGKSEAVPLECAGALTVNKGCRPPKAVIRTNSVNNAN